MKHPETMIYEASEMRTVGFHDAVRRLGKHRVKGRDEFYSTQQVRQVLKGVHTSRKLLRRIKERERGLLDLRFVTDEVRQMVADL